MNAPELWNELGNLYFMSGAYEPAIRSYARAIQVEDKTGRPICNLAYAYAQTGKVHEAVNLYHRSLEMLYDTREKAIAWNRLGELYRQIKDYESAMVAFQQADQLLDGKESQVKMDKLPLSASMPDFDLDSFSRMQVLVEKLGPQEPFDDDVEFNEMFLDEMETEVLWFDGDFVPPDPPYFPPMDLLEDASFEAEATQPEMEDPFSIIPGSEKDGWISIDIEEIEMPLMEIPQKEIEEQEVEPMPIEMPHMQIAALAEADSHQTDITEIGEPYEGAVSIASSETASELSEAQAFQAEFLLARLTSTEIRNIEGDIERFKRIANLNQKNAFAWETLGDLYKSLGNFRDAILSFQKAISIDPRKSYYHYQLGLVYAAQKRQGDAIHAFQKAIEIEPNHALAHASLAGHFRKMGLAELAEKHIEQAIASDGFRDEHEYNKACFHAICGNYEDALMLLEIALHKKQVHISWAQMDSDLDSLRDHPRYRAIFSSFAASQAAEQIELAV